MILLCIALASGGILFACVLELACSGDVSCRPSFDADRSAARDHFEHERELRARAQNRESEGCAL